VRRSRVDETPRRRGLGGSPRSRTRPPSPLATLWRRSRPLPRLG
jgi:hypothetical protein